MSLIELSLFFNLYYILSIKTSALIYRIRFAMRTVPNFILFFLTLFLLSCSSSLDPDYHIEDSLERLPIETLNSAPKSLTVDGIELSLKSDLWRDFMPITPPDGKPLIARIELRAQDERALPEQLNADAVWVLYEDQVWGARLTETQFEHDSTRLVKVARNGPKFGPGENATVVVRIVYGDESYLLRNTGQDIMQTW